MASFSTGIGNYCKEWKPRLEFFMSFEIYNSSLFWIKNIANENTAFCYEFLNASFVTSCEYFLLVFFQRNQVAYVRHR